MTFNDERTQEIARRYDKEADQFLQWTPSIQFRTIFERTVLKLLKHEIAPHKKVRVLDVGCGHGIWIKYLLDNIPDPARLDITGIDLSEKRIDLAKSLLAGYSNVSLKVEDFKRFNSTECYDLIFFAEVFSLIDRRDHEAIISNCLKHLHEGGYLAIIDKERYSWWNLKYRVKDMMKLLPDNHSHAGTSVYVSFPSFKRLSHIAKQNNFRVVETPTVKEFHALILMKKPSSFQES